MRDQKHLAIINQLLEVVKTKYGEGRVEEYKRDFKDLALLAMDREIVCQIVSRQAWYRRIMFFLLFPRYIVPYLIRTRESKTT